MWQRYIPNYEKCHVFAQKMQITSHFYHFPTVTLFDTNVTLSQIAPYILIFKPWHFFLNLSRFFRKCHDLQNVTFFIIWNIPESPIQIMKSCRASKIDKSQILSHHRNLNFSNQIYNLYRRLRYTPNYQKRHVLAQKIQITSYFYHFSTVTLLDTNVTLYQIVDYILIFKPWHFF